MPKGKGLAAKVPLGPVNFPWNNILALPVERIGSRAQLEINPACRDSLRSIYLGALPHRPCERARERCFR